MLKSYFVFSFHPDPTSKSDINFVYFKTANFLDTEIELKLITCNTLNYFVSNGISNP